VEHNEQIAEQELDELRKEAEDFKREKERIRGIVGKIGGVPAFRKRIFETIFLVSVVVLFLLSIFLGEFVSNSLRWIMIDVAIAAISLKLIYMMHNQSKVSHFQLWILTSLEWRLNELIKKIDEIKK